MQGFNMGRYVPPEHEGTTSGNRLHGKKPSGFHGGKQTVRFEMPFNVFCLTCDGHIAQGVRFNAEKKKIGNYYSTSIFAFRMKHATCQGWIEIHTDPQNTQYVCAEGAKKKAADEELPGAVIKIGGLEGLEDPFARAEKTDADKTEARHGAARIKELRELSERQWLDPYEHSRKMRRVFRAEKKTLEAKAAATEALRDRAGLDIELLDETAEDAERAKLVDFSQEDFDQKMRDVHSRPLFTKERVDSSTLRITPKTRSRDAAELTKKTLERDLRKNTRAAVDPFLENSWTRPRDKSAAISLKRKERDEQPLPPPTQTSSDSRQQKPAEPQKEASHRQSPMSLGLDDYGSGSD